MDQIFTPVVVTTILVKPKGPAIFKRISFYRKISCIRFFVSVFLKSYQKIKEIFMTHLRISEWLIIYSSYLIKFSNESDSCSDDVYGHIDEVDGCADGAITYKLRLINKSDFIKSTS
ncbi:hypothetical protein BpHYR1_047006 [Brachionus plicatilis]|uniref:Uncharacterized protein n=1 Tax=Brachionus plicatilis TaxID=10195 RepID=A0A3M7T847_BRAPC|nr:hypothetical protein BpHYR1_047006 [Brachionus plicatilis]